MSKDFNEKQILEAMQIWTKIRSSESEVIRKLFLMPEKEVEEYLGIVKMVYEGVPCPHWLEAANNCQIPQEKAAWAIAEYLSDLSLEEPSDEH